jgi:hypothetical protein
MADRPPLVVHRGARIRATEVDLHGDLRLPDGAWGVVVLADEGRRTQTDPADRTLAELLAERGVGSLSLTTLTREEEVEDELTGSLRFNAPLIARRVVGAFRWLQAHTETSELPMGLVGVGAVAAATLDAGAELGDVVSAIVCIDGRPDLAFQQLSRVAAPTLLIVGEDPDIRALNEAALRELAVAKEISIVPGHSPLLARQLSLEEAARRTADWLERFLAPAV